MNTKTSTGPDLLHAALIKNAGTMLHIKLSELFNYSMKYSVIPLTWKSANICAIYKKKGDRTQPANYRPIAITSVTVRLFERCVKQHLTQIIDPTIIQQADQLTQRIHQSQHGFRRGYSCHDHILSIVKDMDTTILSDLQSTQSAVGQHNTQPIATRARSRHVIH